MVIKLSTKAELEIRKKELESNFNELRDRLAEYIQTSQATINEMTKSMDDMSNEYKEINEELNKRDGNSSKQ